MSFREGIEAFLILILIFNFLHKTDNRHLDLTVVYGFFSGMAFSILTGLSLFLINSGLGEMEEIGELWDSIASIIAVGLVTTFIVWMINHGKDIKQHVENKTALNLNKIGIFFVAFFMIAREGVEISFFAFAGKYGFYSIATGILIALIFSFALYFSIFQIRISTILKITLVYLIIQAGYLLGYGIHEGISTLHAMNVIHSCSPTLIKAFDFSHTILDNKKGWLGIPLNVFLGWYAKPEWIQFAAQYVFTGSLLLYWAKKNGSDTDNKQNHAKRKRNLRR